MKSSSSCPMCRHNLVSSEVWYENNDINNELDELSLLSENIQEQLIHNINENNNAKLKNIKLKFKNKRIKMWNKEEMKRKISVRQDIEYARGYLEALNDECGKTFKKILKKNSNKKCPFVSGYYAGYYNRKSIESREESDKDDPEKEPLLINVERNEGCWY